MRSLTSMALSAAAALLLVTTVHAQQPAPASPPPPLPDYGPNITLDQATAAANAALADAKKLNVVEGIAVVDTAGRLVYFMKMDNARAAAVELAQHKARTAAMYKLPSKAYEQRLAGGGAGLGVLMLDGVIASAGGIPIQQGGKIIGAIGVGGGPNGDIDSKAAQAGVDAVK
jgi:glc operon protein GlcG